MPVVDKLPALLREDLESAFEDNLDNVFDITNLRHSFGQQKRDTEIELKRVTSPNLLLGSSPVYWSCLYLAHIHVFMWLPICRSRGLKRNSDKYMSSLTLRSAF